MNERNFSIGQRNFKLNKVGAITQFHVVRRLGPILGDIIPVAAKIKGLAGGKSDSNLSEDQKFDAIAKIAQPIMTGFSKLSDEDADYVLMGLCSSVEMQQKSGNWARVATPAGLMFEDLEFMELMQIAGRAFAFNLAGFFALAPQVSHGQA